MVLRVEFADFPTTVRRLIGEAEVYATGSGRGIRLTAADPSKGMVIECRVLKAYDDAKACLESDGLSVLPGVWTQSNANGETIGADLTVAAIAYSTKEETPGLWLDAYEGTTTTGSTLKACYEEFLANGEIGELTFEEFVRVAKPNVLICSPDELREFARKKDAIEG